MPSPTPSKKSTTCPSDSECSSHAGSAMTGDEVNIVYSSKSMAIAITNKNENETSSALAMKDRVTSCLKITLAIQDITRSLALKDMERIPKTRSVRTRDIQISAQTPAELAFEELLFHGEVWV